MRLTRIHLLLVCSALIPACAIPGDAPWSDLHANAYVAGFSSTLKASSSNILIPGDGAAPELSGAFSLNSATASTSQVGARVGFAPYELSVSQFSYSRGQTGVFSSDGTGQFGNFTDKEFAINSTLDIDTTKMMLGRDILNTSAARVGVLLGFDLLSLNKFSLMKADSSNTQNVLVDQEIPVPIIGVRADVAIPGTDIRLGAEMTGISIDIDGIEASFFDHDINLNIAIFENAEAVVGYRVIDLSINGDIDGTKINMDLNMSGPYFGVSVDF